MIRLALRVARADAEIVLAELLVLAPTGVEEVDRGTDVEYAVYGSAGELPALPALRAAAGAALVDITTTEIADDWSERWRDFHKPVTIGERLHVRPPWCPAPAPAAGLLDIAIDPAQAFGTGAHDTTRLCLEALLDLGSPTPGGGGVLDLGCGSGVLAIAARKLGWQPVLGLDHEPESVEATRENGAANGVDVEARLFTSCATARRRARRSSSRTSCGRCCCMSPRRASPASRRACSSPAACSRTRPTRSRPRSQSVACTSAPAATRANGPR